jgi:death-on-curing protein
VTEYLSVRQVLRIHALQIEVFGGSAEVRDRGALEAAVARPQTTFDGEDLYRDLADKAAALLHSLVQNHPFIDGNQRVGAMAMELVVVANEHELRAGDDELEALVLAVARGELAAEALAIWFRQRLRTLAP